MKVLNHFRVDSLQGDYGWNQDKLSNFKFRKASCGAVVACDSILNMSMHNKIQLSFDIVRNGIVKTDDYIKMLKDSVYYFPIRIEGISSIDEYHSMYQAYIRNMHLGNELKPGIIYGNTNVDITKSLIKSSIDRNYPLISLTLMHKNMHYRMYIWHYWLILGYKCLDGKFYVQAVTFGGWRWLLFDEIWETGEALRGGLLFLS